MPTNTSSIGGGAAASGASAPRILVSSTPPYWSYADPRPAELDQDLNRVWGGVSGPLPVSQYREDDYGIPVDEE